MYTWDSVWEYHFDFHQAWILEDIDDSVAEKTLDYKFQQYLLIPCPAQNTNPYDNWNAYAGNSSSFFTELGFL